jgi:hypothetical protein
MATQWKHVAHLGEKTKPLSQTTGAFSYFFVPFFLSSFKSSSLFLMIYSI